MRRVGILLLALILIILISGCSGEKLVAKDYFIQALEHNESINDFNFSGELDALNLEQVDDASLAFAGKLSIIPLYLESENRLITTIEENNLFIDLTVLALENSLYVNVPPVLQAMKPELNREYLRFTLEDQALGQLDENWFAKAGEFFTGLPTENFAYTTTSAFSIIKGKASKAVTVTIDSLEDIGPFAELTDLEISFAFDRSDDLRKIVFAGKHSDTESTAVIDFNGVIDITAINKGISNKREPPLADRTIDYDDMDLIPSIK